MSVAILCPGPSLPFHWCNDFFESHELVYAVNVAAWQYTHHWFCGTDRHVVDRLFTHGQMPLVGAMCGLGWRERFARRNVQWARAPLQVAENCSTHVQALVNGEVCAYTFPNAYLLAKQEALDRGTGIEVFGFDAAIAPDFAGINGDHSEDRWATELLWLRSVWLPGTKIHGKASPLFA